MSDTETTTTEDDRLAMARETLRRAKAAAVADEPYAPAEWVGQLAYTVEQLLAYFDERHAALDAAWRKPFDDLAATVAGIEAERGES